MNTLTPSKSNEELLISLGMDTEEEVIAPVIPALKDTAITAPSNHYSPGASSSVEDRALNLLGSGISADSVASALGVTAGRISQLLAEKTFASKVAQLRYENLQSHNKRDDEYDGLEDTLLVKLKASMPLMVRPDTILKAISVINNAKRRGQSAPQQVTNQQNIVNLILPTVVANKFTTNINNQVTKAGEQELLTMPSGNLLKQVEEAEEARLLESPPAPEEASS
jgi:hypothetical protein